MSVYITEAHAADEWPVGKTISFCNQPKTNEARLKLANDLVEQLECKIPMVVDTISNAFEDKFACWPFRFYAVRNGKLCFKGEPDSEQCGYDVTTLSEFLQKETA